MRLRLLSGRLLPVLSRMQLNLFGSHMIHPVGMVSSTRFLGLLPVSGAFFQVFCPGLLCSEHYISGLCSPRCSVCVDRPAPCASRAPLLYNICAPSVVQCGLFRSVFIFPSFLPCSGLPFWPSLPRIWILWLGTHWRCFVPPRLVPNRTRTGSNRLCKKRA